MSRGFTLTKTGIAIGLFLAAAAPASGQFWEKKDWREWTQTECEKLLTDSPWARRFVTTSVANLPASQVSRTVDRESRPEQQQPQQQQNIEYVAQLRSARPIRQAVARMSLIAANYDQLGPAQKQAVEKQTAEYINQDFGNHVVVHVYFSSMTEAIKREMALQWRAELPDKVKTATLLIGSRGEQVQLTAYIPPGRGAQEFELVFPKEWQGKPVAEEDRRIQVQLPGVAFHEGRIQVDFDLRKMKYRGQLEY